ncbi:MAG: radical SAM protein [Candidatus Altiarchaeota archaeon]|nr:radical SAM protein [Candidatus Altiarchaeota archaeon]
MKILLIQPSDAHVDGSLKGGVWHAPPLGIASLAAFLRERKHEPMILDLAVDQRDPVKVCGSFRPDYIGLSVSTPLLSDACSIAKKLKKKFPKARIIFGGPHPSTDVEGVLKNDFVDYVIFGEGEEPLCELLDANEPPGIKGLAFKRGGKIVVNPQRELIADLDSLPTPAYDMLDVFAYPDHPLSAERPNISIITSRGCPFGCTYCNKSVFGRTFRKMGYKKVVDQMEYLSKTYGMREFQIIDDIFTLDKERVRKICDEILKRNLKVKWMTPNGVRADSLDLDTLKLMKKAGCHYLYIGIESGSQRILDRIKKGLTLDQVRRAVNMVNDAGIRVGAFFMLGLPDETPEDMRKTIDFAKSLRLDSVKFGILVPLPGTEVFEEFRKKGFIKNFDYSMYFWHKEPVFETDLISTKELFRHYKKAYREFYFRPRYLLGKLTSIRSASDVNNVLKGLRTVIKNQLSKG